MTEQEQKEALELLRELHDLQNGPPLLRYEKLYYETMTRIEAFLQKHENDERKGVPTDAGTGSRVS